MGIHLFTRDLRVQDNTCFRAHTSLGENIDGVFIIDPRQVSKSNAYASGASVSFMFESLADLSEKISKLGGKLHIFYGETGKVMKGLFRELSPTVLTVAADYTPFAVAREEALRQLCDEYDCDFEPVEDHVLVPKRGDDTITTGSGTVYVKFTPYYNVASKRKIATPSGSPGRIFNNKNITGEISIKSIMVALGGGSASIPKTLCAALKYFGENSPERRDQFGGRSEGVSQLRKVMGRADELRREYDNQMLLTFETTRLSPWIKFGCVSVREVYWKMADAKLTNLTRSLFWREFYYGIATVYELGGNKTIQTNKIKWRSGADRDFAAWCEGRTGIPIVDAGMRQMNSTGWMHNRARLIVANFLVKGLLIDWRLGEQYFAQKLVDYDFSQNNGNWQWNSGTGADSQPYFRVFNPWRQRERFDPECEYTIKYLDEFGPKDKDIVARWSDSRLDIDYPEPIISWPKASKRFKNAIR